MTKPVLRLGFTDYWENLDKFFINWLSQKYEIIRDDVNPDFLIFCDETFGTKNLSYDSQKVIKIFCTGENRRPWNYQCHRAITSDHFDTSDHYRLPLYVMDHWSMVNLLCMSSRFMERRSDDILKKTGFCCFISGNPGNPHRNEFFHKLSKYKKVDSYGPLFNNMGPLPRGLEAAKNKSLVLPNYKFNLCFESADHPGWCTEKIFHALYMKTVPIYCGSTTAAVDFNPEAFLSWHEYLDDDSLLQVVIKLDQNDLLYNSYYMKTEEIVYPEFNKFADPDRFLHWFHKNVYEMKK